MQPQSNDFILYEENASAAELKSLLGKIKEEAARLREVFFTESERTEKQDAIDLYDNKIQEMLVGTRLHLESYKQFVWKDLIYGERNDSGCS